ncbi:MAG: AI-2E family transporter [Chakrabartia sp.]
MSFRLFPDHPMPPPESADGSHLVRGRMSFARLGLLMLVGLTALFLFLTYRMIAPFLPPLASALALAVVLAPVHRQLLRLTRRPGLAAFASVICAVVLIALPLSLLGQQVLVQAGDATVALARLVDRGGWKDIFPTNGWFAEMLEWMDRRFHLPNLADQLSAWVATHLPAIVQGSGEQLVATLLTLYLLFYMMRDRRAALAILATLLPFSAPEMRVLYGRIADTIRATLFGTVMVSMVQGVLGGAMFWLLGLPAPLLWGVVMGVVAIVPVLGTFVIWAPAVLFLLSIGQGGKALILLGWSLLVVSTVDNLLYPVLVGNRLRMHTIPTFISLVGGVLVFGPAGLILGPLVLTITLFLLDYWRNESAAESKGT